MLTFQQAFLRTELATQLVTTMGKLIPRISRTGYLKRQYQIVDCFLFLNKANIIVI